MTRMIAHALAMTLLMGGAASAQVKTLQGATQITTATVESIERSTREVTLKNAKGEYDVLHVPADVKRFDTLKVGDTVKIRYYENIVLRPHTPGEAPLDTSSKATTKTADKMAGTKARQRTITATITEIDRNLPSVTFTGPNGWTYSSRVEDKEALAKVKVGDQFDITWTTATLVAIDDER